MLRWSTLLSVGVPRRLLLAIPAITILLLSVLRFLRGNGTLTFWGYGMALVSGVLIITFFAVWEGLKLAPTGFATVSEKSFSIGEPFKSVIEVVPKVLSQNHWKLEEADINNGHFKARIGMSLHTFNSIMQIDVSNASSRSVNIHVLCGTRSLNDPGHNDKMIAKFSSKLLIVLKDSQLV